MVVEFERSVFVPCSASQAFAIADMATLADWNAAVARSELVEGQPLVVGARYACTLARGPVRLSASPILVEMVPDGFVRYAGRFGPAHSEDSIRFTPEGKGTRLTFRNLSTLPGWVRPMRLPITKLFHRQANRAIEGAVRDLRS